MKKLVYHHHVEYPEHDWVRDKDGNIDEFAFEFAYHNGPCCRRCFYSFCISCKGEEGYSAQPCVEDWYECPKCGKKFYSKGDNYCSKCGQELSWEVSE